MSTLWSLQRAYFEAAGPRAWSENVVPSFITTNSFIARAYARLAEAYEPRTIVELGAGSGRFAHHFLKHYAGGARYVMTDVSPANVQAWRAHPKLRPFIEAGVLDCALWDPLADEPLEVDGPLLAIANYVFDGIEHDVYAVQQGVLVGLAETAEGPLERVVIEHRPRPVTVYSDPDLNGIIKAYESLEDGAFILPTGAIKAIERLRASCERLLVLVGDKGKRRVEDYRGEPPPQPTRHGSVSFDVNFHALAAFCRAKGGTLLEAPQPAYHLEVQGYLFGPAARALGAAFESWIGSRGPDDLYTMKKAVENNYRGWSLAQLIGFLRLTAWDASIVQTMYSALFDALEGAEACLLRELAEGLAGSWDCYFPVGEAEDYAFMLANLMAAMGKYTEALDLFLASERTYGGDEVRVNIDLCRRLLRGER